MLLLISLQPPGTPVPQEPDIGRAYLYAALMFLFPLVGAMALVHSNRLAIQVQIKLRAELTSAVYRKALRLSARYVLRFRVTVKVWTALWQRQRSTEGSAETN